MSDRDSPAAPTDAKPPSPSRRSRSRSPPRQSKKSSSGFKWKQKPSAADGDDSRRDSRRSRYDDDPRGSSSRPSYRDDYRRDPRDRDSDRPRDSRDADRDRNRDRDTRRRSRSPRRDRDDRPRDRDRDRDNRPPRREKKDKPAPAPAPAPAAAVGGEEMIIVHVNDRLGTKAAIPCFGSDLVGQFKVMVAGRIGREPHEILLKRQGERPFKDHISLADYGVSNGVQLDLEVDTGD